MAAYNSAYTGEQIDEAIGQVPHKADRTLSNLSDNATALYNLGAASNSNLLDNWYFADPIDQRQGHVVPPGTAYFSDTGLSAQAGTVSGYTTANYVDGVYGSIRVDSTTYYVDWMQAARGYVRDRTGLDRWPIMGDFYLLEPISTGAKVTLVRANDNYKYPIYQVVDQPHQYIGKKVTISALIEEVSGENMFLRISCRDSSNESLQTIDARISSTGLIQATGIIPEGTVSFWASICFTNMAVVGETVTVCAMKLELGSVQTLAHEDAEGNWVLNDPPPNRGLELLKCQRYYQLFSSAEARPANLADYRPVMRANPALGTINVNGQTMYFADANL